MIIDATDLIVGRLGTAVAKKALLGEEIIIVNSEKAIITGKKERVFADYKQRLDRGTFKGPFLPRRSDYLLKRSIRGMLPYKKPRGAEAFKRIRCFVGVPTQYKAQDKESIKDAHISKMQNLDYVTIKEIVTHLGGKA